MGWGDLLSPQAAVIGGWVQVAWHGGQTKRVINDKLGARSYLLTGGDCSVSTVLTKHTHVYDSALGETNCPHVALDNGCSAVRTDIAHGDGKRRLIGTCTQVK